MGVPEGKTLLRSPRYRGLGGRPTPPCLGARTPRLTAALQEFGVTDFEDNADGFVATRPEPPAA